MKYKTLSIRNVVLGSGIPKICVPIVEMTEEAILAAAEQAAGSSADLVEWRCDHYERLQEEETAKAVKGLLEKLRRVLGDKPLLFTYRTTAEGGASPEEITPEVYEELNRAAICSGCVDVIDMELRIGEEMAGRLKAAACEQGVRLLMSFHDFRRTPSAEALLERYKAMEHLGADVLKIAVMPQCDEDVRTLMTACNMASEQCSQPVIGISMGSMGMESRVGGEAFGSVMTFGCLEKASAPGQMEVEQLRMALEERQGIRTR